VKGLVRNIARDRCLNAWRRRLRQVGTLLGAEYGSPRLGNVKDATDELIYILLSNRTDPRRYPRVFREMRRRYRPWSRLLDVPLGELEFHLRPLGLEKTRAHRILAIAQRVYRDFGSVSLNRLRRWTAADAREYLLSLPGVGEKTARCVLMYSFGHDVTPVDTHQLRVLVRLGLLPAGTHPRRAYELLDKWLPPGLARRLHVNLVAHGRAICTPRRPHCGECSLQLGCPTAAGQQLR